MCSLETSGSSAKLLLLLLMTSCSSFGPPMVPPLSGVCMCDHESNIELAANFCFTEFGGFLTNQTGPSPLSFQMTSSSKNTGFEDCARLPALLRAQLDELFR